jgi:excisionase family DNA binding protein
MRRYARTKLSGEILTTVEVADYLRLNQKVVRNMALEGRIPALSIGGEWRFRKKAIDQWLDKNAKKHQGRS